MGGTTIAARSDTGRGNLTTAIVVGNTMSRSAMWWACTLNSVSTSATVEAGVET